MATVPDPRLEALRDLFNPRRYVPATVTVRRRARHQDGARAPESLDLAKLKNVDALVHVVRAFSDPEILHTDGASTRRATSPPSTWS